MPGNSSTKSNGASTITEKAAVRLAADAFLRPTSLPFEAGAAASTGAAEDGRRKLKGAFAIQVERIRPDPTQPRKRLDTRVQEELNASVRRLGILQAITVRYIESENIYQIIAGERRYQAACSMGLLEIPCWVQSPRDDEVLLHQIVENWQRADMHPFDLADALVRLRDLHGLTQQEIAQQTGKSEGEISKLLKILDLDPDVQKTARSDTSGLLSRRHLYALSRLSPTAQRSLLASVLQDQMTAEDTEHLVLKTAKTAGHIPPGKRGSPVTRVRYATTAASVQVTFRRKSVTPEEILAALNEAQMQARQDIRHANGD